MNHYVVLGVPIDADDRDIRRAFRSLVRRYHPDAGEGSSPEKFRLLVEAYETLCDPARRRAYDRSLRASPPRLPVRVEPMAVPVEPLAPLHRRPAPTIYRVPTPQRPAPYCGGLFDELWQAMEEDFFFRPFAPRW